MPTAKRKKPIIMVSSSIYQIRDLLDQIYAMLEAYGYTVWMSHAGTIPTDSTRTNFENCLEAVDRCDLFLGIITGNYGSGVDANEASITHQELLRAIQRDKLRWFLVHHDVTVARQLLKQFRFNDDGTPKPLAFKPNSILSDIRVLEMYESAIRTDRPLSQRTGNWVQEYSNAQDAIRYIRAQFEDPDRILALLNQSSS
jgi:hypothetical protein